MDPSKLKNGRYTDWKSQAKIKMAFYSGSTLVRSHYSFQRDDLKNRHNPLETINTMAKRLVFNPKYLPWNIVVFFDNQSGYPHKILRMYGRRLNDGEVQIIPVDMIDRIMEKYEINLSH